jgi:hypothetical protein
MKRTYILLLMLSTFIILNAINFIEGPHKQVLKKNNTRTTTIAWHHGIDDQHWYGTNQWAVRFQYNAILGTADSVYFTPSIARIYLPELTPSIHVLLCADEANFPSSSIILANGSAVNVQGLTDITLLPVNTSLYPLGRKVAWLVVTMPTAATGPYVAAENTGGQNSYFWNDTPGIDPYYQSMASLGYSSEFLFSLVGEYTYFDHSYELELQSFKLAGNPAPDSILTPIFTIRNASSNTISKAKLLFQLTSAFSGASVVDSVNLPILLPNAVLTVNASESDIIRRITLLSDPCQYSYIATLQSGYADTLDYAINNTISGSFDTFNTSMQKFLIENFLHNSLSVHMLINNEEENISGSHGEIINYYPETSDLLYNSDAYSRYLYYRNIGYPEIIMNGTHRIHGFLNDFENQYIAHADSLSQKDKTFIRELQIQQPYIDNNRVNFELTFENADTYIFDDYLARCRLYIALVETISASFNYPDNIFVGFFATDDSLAIQLPFGQSRSKMYSMSVAELDTLNLNNTSIRNCSLVYFLQNLDDKRIYITGNRTFGHISPIDDQETAGIQKPAVFPNPCFIGNSVHITVPKNRNCTDYQTQVYNIRGQLVYSFPKTKDVTNEFVWDLKDATNKLVTSGVYLIRIEGMKNNKSVYQSTKKIVLVN